MDHLTEEQLSMLRAQLEHERERFRARTDAVVGAREQDDVVETQDAASIEDHRQRDIRLAARAQARLRSVEAALQRMADGVYGICEESGEPIPFGRLRSEPTTRFTVEAAESLESTPADGDGSRDDPGAY